ncbi:hypothetical protein LUX05_02770 [Streptomyces somaliensis]|nr:hypothetical protein [Streptomyces somaliensis]
MQTTPPAASLRPGATDRVARAAAIAACLPYLALKAAWLAGGRVGIPEGSVLLEQPRLMAVANTVTLLMDTAVIVLALLLTQRWGERVPAWLPAFPAWVATGLLLPIAVGFPLNALAGLLGGGRPAAGPSEPFLDAWVFTVVYGGFTVQGLALGTLFVRYAGRRWSPLWRGAVRDLPPRVAGPRVRAAAVAASLALVPGTAAHLGWAAGMTEGLPRPRPPPARRGSTSWRRRRCCTRRPRRPGPGCWCSGAAGGFRCGCRWCWAGPGRRSWAAGAAGGSSRR